MAADADLVGRRSRTDDLENRLLLVASSAREGEALRKVLRSSVSEAVLCENAAQFCVELDRGAAAAVVTARVIDRDFRQRLSSTLALQPLWSDFPLVILVDAKETLWKGPQECVGQARLTVLQRPISRAQLVGIVRCALAARQRQYLIRDELAQRIDIQSALQSSENRLRRAQLAGNIGVWEYDIQSGQRIWSDVMWQLYGHEPKAPADPSEVLRTTLTPEDYDRLQQDFTRCIDGDCDRVRTVIRITRPDGVVRWLQIIGDVVRAEDGRATGIAGVSLDITEHKRAEERKDHFLATLGHELRNPLASLGFGLELLMQAAEQPAEVLRYCDLMSRELAQVTRLTDDLLDLSRIAHGKLELRQDRVDLHQALLRAVEDSERLVRAAKHEIRLVPPKWPLLVHADATRLSQIFFNLIINATKYTPPGGHLELGLECCEGQAHAWVRDDGIGIPPEKIDSIFNVFEQLDSRLDQGYNGLGIGLYLARSLAELHGGRLEVESAGLGQGSTFHLWLPLPLPEEAGEPDRGHRIPPPRPSAPCRVLVVDDNVDVANSFAQLLTMLGHEVRVAFDGSHGLELAEAFRPALVFLDLGLPEMNGFEVAQRLRACPWGRELTLIAISGWGSARHRERSKQVGFDAHLTKPVKLSEIQPYLDERERRERAVWSMNERA